MYVRMYERDTQGLAPIRRSIAHACHKQHYNVSQTHLMYRLRKCFNIALVIIM